MQTLKKFYFGKSKFKPFVSTWKTDNLSSGSSTATQVKLPLVSTGSYNFFVEWGDGTSSNITSWNQADVTHTYSTTGTYTIVIKGTCIGWQFNNTGDRSKILSISQWGCLRFTNSSRQFFGCNNLNLSSVSDLINLSNVSTATAFFSGCTSLTTINRANEWSTGFTIASQMFQNSTSFNQNIGNWNMSSCIDMTSMFAGCSSFNQNINSWNVSNVSYMSNMFQNCTSFNQNIGNWNVAKVFVFSSMFRGATAFNNGGSNDIGNWILNTTANVSTDRMFESCPNFNQNIGGWNVSRVTVMNGMFSGATAFNQNIGGWNISNVTNLSLFMSGKTPATFSTSNLDAIYNGWSSIPVKTPITITFGTAKYTAASSAGRAILTGAPNNWAITDGGI